MSTLNGVAATPGGAARVGAALGRTLDGVDWIAGKTVVLAMIGMVSIVSAQVFMRYALNLSIDWAEEVSRLLFVWSVFLAIPLGIRHGAHVGMTLLTGVMPEGPRAGLARLMALMGMGLMAMVGWQGAILTIDQWDEPMSTLDVSVGFFMLPVCIGALHGALHLLSQALGRDALDDGESAE